MAIKTKERILDSAITLFNEKGVANVRLQQIADESGISVGNLAYHFQNKDAILVAVYDRMDEVLTQILGAYLVHPGLLDLDHQLRLLYGFFDQYRFYLIDLPEVERSFPCISANWQRHFAKLHTQFRFRLDYLTQKQLMRPEAFAGEFDLLARTLWMESIFYFHTIEFKGELPSANGFFDSVWRHLTPFLTETGKAFFLHYIEPSLR
jgi:AcrR family transcriptional regulator